MYPAILLLLASLCRPDFIGMRPVHYSANGTTRTQRLGVSLSKSFVLSVKASVISVVQKNDNIR